MPRLSKIGAAALAAFGWTGISSVTASYLVVAGGGGGGASNAAAGGGAGGYRTETASLNPTLSYTVTVGAGGAGSTSGSVNGVNGSNSVFNALTSAGGGGGASDTSGNGSAGGSGGGAAADVSATGGAGNTPSVSPSQGNNGGNFTNTAPNYGGGGGGGASAVGATGTGTVGGNGGAGTASSISGSSVTYAGGGGAGTFNGGTAGTGGAGGGGNAGTWSGQENGSAGTANLGGGGGGSSYTGKIGGSGGSGIVIISYAGAQQFSGGVVTSVGGNTIHTFTTSGTLGPITTLSASYLIVAGGGGGGSGITASTVGTGGGGGAGGLLSGSGVTIDPNSTYLVTVGAGGAGGIYSGSINPVSGTDSTFSMVATAAVGGGAGGTYNGNNPASGGSGGGEGYGSTAGAAGTAGQGFAGGADVTSFSPYGGGGGGGAGGVGGSASAGVVGVGGVGVASSITGTSTFYAGGGGGGSGVSATAGGVGGNGGGGQGGYGTIVGVAGTANLGGGGGGGGNQGPTGGTPTTNGGNGGSGVVIISYAGATQLMAGGTVTITGGNVIHTFTSTGYLAPLKLVNNSLRFRSSASAYLSRTPASATNRKTWTWSGWVKRGALSSSQALFSCESAASNYSVLYFSSANILQFYSNSGGTDYSEETVAVFRDPAAWYHIVFALDTTQATASNRAKIYINGVQQTTGQAFGQIPQNNEPFINSLNQHAIGRDEDGNVNYFDGYLTEVNFIDGQALTPSSFGTINSYGVWQPITYGGSYGTNGFYLPFTNTTSTTTLGYDFSPQGNNWTTNNISLTAGTTYDSMTDVPTLTSATAANYAVLNPLEAPSASVISNGNLQVVLAATGTSVTPSTIGVVSGKWYAEFLFSATASGNAVAIGVGPAETYQPNIFNVGVNYFAFDGTKYVSGVNTSYGATWTTGDIIGIALDVDGGTITFYKNNASQGAITLPASASGWKFCTQNGGGSSTKTMIANFGQRPFTYTPPSGFVGLNTFNL